MATTSKFQKMILDNKDKLLMFSFKIKIDKTDYKFIIHNIWNDSLNIIIFIRYGRIITGCQYDKYNLNIAGYPIERRLKKVISEDAESEFDLKMDAKIKKPKLFKETVLVKIDNVRYKFKISGAGEDAIRLSHKITYEDLNIFDDKELHPLENKLKNIIYFICTGGDKTWDMSYFEVVHML